MPELNLDGLVGPSHTYAGLSLGNLAATGNAVALCPTYGTRSRTDATTTGTQEVRR